MKLLINLFEVVTRLLISTTYQLPQHLYLSAKSFTCNCLYMTILKLCYPRSFQVLNALLSQLTLPAPCISERYIKIKIKTFIKPFETPQRSVKIKIQVTFFSLSGIRTGKIYKKLSILHQLYHQFFLNFDMVLETHMKMCVKERDFPEKTFLLPKLRKWTKNSFLNLLKKFVL